VQNQDNGISPEGSAEESASPAAVFRALDNQIYIEVQGSAAEYQGSFGIYLKESTRMEASSVGMTTEGTEVLEVSEDMSYFEMAAGVSQSFKLELEEGAVYALEVIDSYSAPVFSQDASEFIKAVWFVFRNEDGSQAYNASVYKVAEYTSSLDLDGGYTSEGSRISAEISGKKAIELYIEGSKSGYSGKFGLRIYKKN
jgi:hypothetical protein